MAWIDHHWFGPNLHVWLLVTDRTRPVVHWPAALFLPRSTAGHPNPTREGPPLPRLCGGSRATYPRSCEFALTGLVTLEFGAAPWIAY
ncbi:MAG: hypothetical protein ACRDTG_00750 [Pseudonocardiaceae bacterium]